MEEEGTRAFRQAKRQSNADIIGGIAQMGATIGAGVSQNIQNKNAVDMYGKLIQARGQTFTPEDTNAFISNISTGVQKGNVDPAAAMQLMGELSKYQEQSMDINKGVNLIKGYANLVDPNNENPELQTTISGIAEQLKNGQLDFNGAKNLTLEAINVSEQTNLINTNTKSLLQAGYSEQQIGDMPRSIIGDKTAVNKMISEKELINTNAQLAKWAGVEEIPEEVLANQTLFNAYMKENQSGMNEIQKAAIAATSPSDLDAILENNPNISMKDYNFVMGIKDKIEKTETATDTAKTGSSSLIAGINRQFEKTDPGVVSINDYLSDPVELHNALMDKNSQLYKDIESLTPKLDSNLDIKGWSPAMQEMLLVMRSEKGTNEATIQRIRNGIVDELLKQDELNVKAGLTKAKSGEVKSFFNNANDGG